ncbi:hypothetical protein ACWA1C_25450, partial [Flectobacillus roseus]
AKAGVAQKAIHDKALYETIVAHRYTFSRVGGVDYNTHNPKSLNPVPLPHIIGEWRADYKKMMEDMIYETNKPTFEDLVDNLEELKEQLQTLDWQFELKFSS